MTLGLFLYFVAFCAQAFAVLYAVRLFLTLNSYRLVSGFLALGLCLMLGRRISSFLYGLNNQTINMIDAWLSVFISAFLLLGMIFLKRLLIDLENKNTTLDQLSKKDSLTLALTHSETIARAELEIKQSFRSQKSIAFLMLDIDHFKLINDTYGHPIGDCVLINLASTCQEELREVDVFGRVGGEEFLIVLPETSESVSIKVANRLRLKIAQRVLATAGEKSILITVSIGIAIFDPQVDQSQDSKNIIEKYYSLCDSAMYQAKQTGRNKVSKLP